MLPTKKYRTLALAACLTLAYAPLFAHSKPKEMVPAANSTVTAPTKISIEFTEALEPKFSSLQLTGERANVLSKANAVVDPADRKHMTLDLPHLPPGVYTVHWVTAATDGHRMTGNYSFTVK